MALYLQTLGYKIGRIGVRSLCNIMGIAAIYPKGNPITMQSDDRHKKYPFTSEKFTNILKNNDIRISMDGKCRALDNIFIERLWRSVKYECVYLNAFEDGLSLRKGLEEYFNFYNHERKHQSLDYKTPYSCYFESAA